MSSDALSVHFRSNFAAPGLFIGARWEFESDGVQVALAREPGKGYPACVA